jgi:hypothetical protein
MPGRKKAKRRPKWLWAKPSTDKAAVYEATASKATARKATIKECGVSSEVAYAAPMKRPHPSSFALNPKLKCSTRSAAIQRSDSSRSVGVECRKQPALDRSATSTSRISGGEIAEFHGKLGCLFAGTNSVGQGWRGTAARAREAFRQFIGRQCDRRSDRPVPFFYS